MSEQTRILIIDDDTDYRASLRAFLESEGYSVCDAATGHDGLDAAIAEKPDLIVLDVMMESPVEGYSVNQAIKYDERYAGLRDIPIIMVSAIQESPTSRFPMSPEAEMISPDVYATKPLNLPAILETIRRMTGSAHRA